MNGPRSGRQERQIGMNILKAHHQWSERPDDERFWTLEDLHASTKAVADTAVEQDKVQTNNLRVEKGDGDNELILAGKKGMYSNLTHWAFGQVCRAAQVELNKAAPADFFRSLPATLAAQNLNYGLSKLSNSHTSALLFNRLNGNGDLILRALTGTLYSRVWNHTIASRLLELPANWKTPPARPVWNRDTDPRARIATEADTFAGSLVKPGELIVPSGLYASDHDLFVFLVDTENRVEDGSEGGLYRAVMLWNGEVGELSLGYTECLVRVVCGNHILWDVTDYREVRVRHVGAATESKFWNQLEVDFREISGRSASDETSAVEEFKRAEFKGTKEEFLSVLIERMKGKGIAAKTLRAAYDVAEENVDTDGSPRSKWGMFNGLTRLSQQTTYTDKRTDLDRNASKVLKVDFA